MSPALLDSAHENPDIGFILHGPKDELDTLVAKRQKLWPGRCEIRDAADVVTMDDKPSQVVRNGKDTSMWSAIESVRNGEATVCCVLRQHRRADGAVDDPPAQAARREPPGHRRSLALAQPARVQRDAGRAAPISAPMPRICCNMR